MVNYNKSIGFCSANTGLDSRRAIENVLGIKFSSNLGKYLGLPNVVGKKKKASFQSLKDRMKLRVNNWSSRLSSQGGKEIFVKSVLQSFPTYAMSCFLLSKTFYSELESIIARYWWQKEKGRKGIHWCTWSKMCHLKEYGGWGSAI